MKRYKLNLILCLLGIILISIFMMYSTYAYFTVDVKGKGNDIVLSTFDKSTTIIYNDTSNVSMVNAYTGDEIVKTFSIENTSDFILYYDILLNNVVNNFANKDDLVYTLESNNVVRRTTSIIPSKDEAIASDIMIKPKEKHEYTMTITFLKKDTNQNENMDKTFSSNIQVKGSKNINVGEKIYKDNTLLKEIITLSQNEGSNILYTNNSSNGKGIYYYFGNDVNNNLIYNNMCFKIIRTDEEYGIRLIYNGKYDGSNCSIENYISKTKYNLKSNSNAFVGFMYGDASSNNYNNEHSNINNSNIKNTIETWYKENFINDNNISNESIFCNNRKMNSFSLKGVLYSKKGYGKSNTGYYDLNGNVISYDCPNNNDRFSTLNKEANNHLDYPVGLISVDEVLLSGNNSYLYTDNYWTITPAYFDGSDAYNYIVSKDGIKALKVNNEAYIIPVLSLNKNVIIESGDGSVISPYIVK